MILYLANLARVTYHAVVISIHSIGQNKISQIPQPLYEIAPWWAIFDQGIKLVLRWKARRKNFLGRSGPARCRSTTRHTGNSCIAI